MSPWTRASPITCPTTRRLRHPSALSVPNSRIRRPTADKVRRLATAKATTSATIESHAPRWPARLEALDSDPVTCDARSFAVVTVAFGSACLISDLTAEMFDALSALT